MSDTSPCPQNVFSNCFIVKLLNYYMPNSIQFKQDAWYKTSNSPKQCCLNTYPSYPLFWLAQTQEKSHIVYVQTYINTYRYIKDSTVLVTYMYSISAPTKPSPPLDLDHVLKHRKLGGIDLKQRSVQYLPTILCGLGNQVGLVSSRQWPCRWWAWQL